MVGQIHKAAQMVPLTFLGEEQLIYNDVVRVDFVRRQLLYQPFGLIQRKEFGDAYTNECRFLLQTRCE